VLNRQARPWALLDAQGLALLQAAGSAGTATAATRKPAHSRHLPCSLGGVGPAGPPGQYPILGYWQVARWAGAVDKSIHSAEYQRFCELLRQLRHEAGLTQVQVAERLDEPQSFVSKYESGERRLDVIELRQVAAAVGLSLDKVVTRLEADESAYDS